MSLYTSQILIDQIYALSDKLGGSFPYDDCNRLFAQIRETVTVQADKKYGDLIPDLDAYFYLVESHSMGVAMLANWPSSELSISQKLLKNSFFQTHTRYRDVEWMINEINTPRLHQLLTVSNELRSMLQKLIIDTIEESKRINLIRQEEFLYA